MKRYMIFSFLKYFSYSKFVSIYWRKLTIVYIIVSLQKGSWSRALDKSKSKRKQFPSLSFSFSPVSPLSLSLLPTFPFLCISPRTQDGKIQLKCTVCKSFQTKTKNVK